MAAHGSALNKHDNNTAAEVDSSRTVADYLYRGPGNRHYECCRSTSLSKASPAREKTSMDGGIIRSL